MHKMQPGPQVPTWQACICGTSAVSNKSMASIARRLIRSTVLQFSCSSNTECVCLHSRLYGWSSACSNVLYSGAISGGTPDTELSNGNRSEASRLGLRFPYASPSAHIAQAVPPLPDQQTCIKATESKSCFPCFTRSHIFSIDVHAFCISKIAYVL